MPTILRAVLHTLLIVLAIFSEPFGAFLRIPRASLGEFLVHLAGHRPLLLFDGGTTSCGCVLGPEQNGFTQSEKVSERRKVEQHIYSSVCLFFSVVAAGAVASSICQQLMMDESQHVTL